MEHITRVARIHTPKPKPLKKLTAACEPLDGFSQAKELFANEL